MWSKVERRGGASSYRSDWNCAISRSANTRSLMLNSYELHFENFEMRVSVDALSHPPNAFCLFDVDRCMAISAIASVIAQNRAAKSQPFRIRYGPEIRSTV